MCDIVVVLKAPLPDNFEIVAVDIIGARSAYAFAACSRFGLKNEIFKFFFGMRRELNNI